MPRSAVPSWSPSRVLALIMSGVLIALLARDLIEVALRWDEARGSLGADYGLYMDATRRWMGGGGFYLPGQLSGPYPVVAPAVLYPPTALLLFVPFTLLPPLLWWVIPIATVGWVVRHHRPRPLVWPVLALCLWFPTTSEVVFAGNPVMWVVAAVALGTVHGWPSALALLKPTVAPFALLGLHRRSWWMAAAGAVLVSLVFLPIWHDYALALLNARDPLGPLYSLNQFPTLMLPIVAWLGASARRRPAPAPVPSVDRSRETWALLDVPSIAIRIA